jgi:hypothetical protein
MVIYFYWVGRLLVAENTRDVSASGHARVVSFLVVVFRG